MRIKGLGRGVAAGRNNLASTERKIASIYFPALSKCAVARSVPITKKPLATAAEALIGPSRLVH
jgi:hypothetical protein